MNVLSVDFDIIMAPDINLYNTWVNAAPETNEKGEQMPPRTVDVLAKDYPMLNGCRADLHHYQKIVNAILTILPGLKVEDIRVSYNHEDIKYVLENLEEADVYNIDHHHDMGYMAPDGNLEEPPVCSCANWVQYFKSKGIIKNYTWIKNENSELNPMVEENAQLVNLISVELLEILPRIDKLFICLSPEWTPGMYHPLFYTLLDLINRDKHCTLEMH